MAWLASDHLREAAGSGTDFTGLFFIVTWINAIAVQLQATVSSPSRLAAGCPVRQLRNLA
jgi:hypothetical protein